eukprot:8040593-Pyramimonas_sp.AAC.1
MTGSPTSSRLRASGPRAEGEPLRALEGFRVLGFRFETGVLTVLGLRALGSGLKRAFEGIRVTGLGFEVLALRFGTGI